MPDNLDSLMQGFVNTLISKATAAIAKSNVSGGGIGGGGGVTPGAALAGAAAATAASSMTASFPPLQQASNLALATARTTLFGGAPTTAGTQAMQMALSRSSTVVSPLDAPLALQRAQAMGLSPALSGFNNVMAGASQVSNLLPGVGVSGGMQVMSALQQPQTVNMARLIGIQLRGPDGMPAQINDVVNQIWQQMVRLYGGSGPTKQELALSLLPGNATWSMITNYFGTDEFLKQAIVTGLYAKASGAKNLSQKELLRVGVTTPEILAQSKRRTQSLGFLQSVSGGMLTGAEMGQAVGGAMTDFATSLNNAIPVLSALAGLGAAGSTFNVGYAEGGNPAVNKPAIVGERGPEVFIPSTSGYIVPNHMLPQGNGSSWPAFMKDGGNIPHGTGADIKKWSTAFLTQLGQKMGVNLNTPANLEAIGRWAQREGGWKMNDAAYNPLNTTQPMEGSWKMNDLGSGMGVQGYSNFQSGIDATIKTIMSKDGKRYKGILEALKKGDNALRVLDAVGKSPWGTPGGEWSKFRAVWDSKASPLPGYITPGELGSNTETGSTSLFGDPAVGGAFASAADVISFMRAKPQFGNLAISAPVIGKRKSGGNVSAGVNYLVGEAGPEKFVPSSAPSGGAINYGGVTIHIHGVPQTMNEEALVREIQRALEVNNIHRRAASE